MKRAPAITAEQRKRLETLLVLSVCFIAVYSLQVAAPGLPAGLRFLIGAASWVIWALFAVDLAIRIWLSERRLATC